MSKMSEKMYGNSPKLEREEESGKVSVKKKVMDKDTSGEGEDQGSGEAIPVTSRHAMERMEMHHKHMRDHHTHDMGKHGDKKEMHKRHSDEMESMMKRHEKELKGKEKE